MKLYNEICRFYMEMYKSSTRQDFVEEYIEFKKDELLKAYTSILVYPKQGNEYINLELASKMKHENQFYALRDYIDNTKEKIVCLTDDFIEVTNKLILNTLIKADLGKEVVIHLYVENNKILEVNHCLDEIIKEEISEDNLLIEWKYLDNGYIFQLEKRINGNDIVMRLYPDGRGVVMSHLCDGHYNVSYFVLEDSNRDYLNNFHRKKANQIIENPYTCFEDDRYFGYNSVLWYGLICVDNLVYYKLNEYELYESKEYNNDEKSFEIIDYLFSIYDVKCIWERHLNIILSNEKLKVNKEVY